MAGNRLTAMIFGLFIAAAATETASAGPAVSTRWQVAKISQEECLQRAERAITAMGFGRLERTEQSRYGTREDYTAAVRCVISNEIVFLIVSGPSRQLADSLAGQLFQNYTADRK